MADNVDSFLKNIEQIESSGGQNTDHPVMESGIHAGQSAIGRYGLMPNTIKEIINRERMAGNNQPIYDLLEELDPDELKNFIEQSPELENQLAKTLATRVLGKTGGDEEKAAFAWNMGHNLTPEQIEERDYQSSPYVQKFETLSQMNQPAEVKPEIKLASKVNAPIPSFANESGKSPTRSIFEKLGGAALDAGSDLLDKGLENYDEGARAMNDAVDPIYHLSGGKERSPIQIDPLGFQGSIKNVARTGLSVETPFIKRLRDQWNKPAELVDDVAKESDEFGAILEQGTNPGIGKMPTELPPSKAQLNQIQAVNNASDRMLSPFQKEILDNQELQRRINKEMRDPEPIENMRNYWESQVTEGKSLPVAGEAFLEGVPPPRKQPFPKKEVPVNEEFLSTMGLEKEPVASQNSRLEMLRKLMK